MSSNICSICCTKTTQMKENFFESVQNHNIIDFFEHFCLFVFDDTNISIEESCETCWNHIYAFSQFCAKIRSSHQQETIDDENMITIEKTDLSIEVLEDDDGDKLLENYEYTEESLPMLTIDANLDPGNSPINRRNALTPQVIACLNRQLQFKPQSIDLYEVDFERFSRFIPMECSVCKFHFESFEEFHDHYLYLHNRPAVWNCCNLTLETPYDALDHMKYHESIEVFKCAACHKCFLTSNKLKYHIRRTHLPLDEGQFDCSACKKMCKTLRALLNHQKCHIQIVCTQCREHIPASNYEQHVNTTHVAGKLEKKRKAFCKNDGPTTKNRKKDNEPTPTSSLKVSKQQNSTRTEQMDFAVSSEPNESGMFECDICRMEFKQLSLVFSHRNKVHV